MRQYGIKIGIPEEQLPIFNDLPLSLLIGFLIEAKKQTYANKKTEKVSSSRRGPSSFENQGYLYKFKTEGTIENFVGTEEIYKDDKLIYRLNCHGGIIEQFYKRK